MKKKRVNKKIYQAKPSQFFNGDPDFKAFSGPRFTAYDFIMNTPAWQEAKKKIRNE